MAETVRRKRFGLDERLKGALLQHKPLSFDGVSERLFGLMFSGLVYPQIWEDPEIDLAAMQLEPHHRVATIASGGCNMLTYLAVGPASIDVADLNASHIALNKLKIAAFAHLPNHPDVMRFFGIANEPANSTAYFRFIAPHLDFTSRRYWEKRRLNGKKRIDVFNGNFYRTGLLGRFIGASHMAARFYGIDLTELMEARTLEEQREFFDRKIAPVFDRKVVRWITARKSSLFGLGIPPRQFDELASLTQEKTLAGVLRERVEKLACHFPLNDNYFAWQAFARRYPTPEEGKLPPYLTLANYQPIKQNVDRVTMHHADFAAMLGTKADQSMDRYVLLDAQDWMTDDQLNSLRREITRTARAGARVIFRTAAEKSIVAGRLAADIEGRWTYLRDRSLELNRMDRSAIYGGFHIYELALMTDASLLDGNGHSRLMDRVYRHQRHFYDVTRKYYLLGRDRLILGLDLSNGQSLLEVGCGTGRNLAVAANHYPDAHLFGLDISAEMLATARRNLSGQPTEPVLKRLDATSFTPAELGAQGFDRIMISYALSMIPEWEKTVTASLAALNLGGSLHIADFGQQERLPRWFGRLLRAWLKQFHVTPRADLESALRRAIEGGPYSLTFTQHARGYAWLAIIRRN